MSLAAAASAFCSCGTDLPQVPDGAAPIEYQNVVVHDPSIMKAADGMYYVNGSDMAGARSADLINWLKLSIQNR